jgi:6-pyruvoyl-tetrahydropterin synthase
MIRTGVTVTLSCSHGPVNPELFGGEEHGHSYEVTVWFDAPLDQPRDVRVCHAAVDTLRKQIDHKRLPPELSTAEAIAAYFGILANVVEVEVRRPLERFHARWERD